MIKVEIIYADDIKHYEVEDVLNNSDGFLCLLSKDNKHNKIVNLFKALEVNIEEVDDES